MKIKLLLLQVVVLISFSSCNKDDSTQPHQSEQCITEPQCQEQLLPFTNFSAEYGCLYPDWRLEINLENDYSIIHSQAVFDSLVSGPCTPLIDFSVFDLIVGTKRLANSTILPNYSFKQKCNPSYKHFKVVIREGNLTSPSKAVYHALIPKLASGDSLFVEVITY